MVPKRLAATHQPPLKAVSPADITVVTSAEQLQNATLTQAEDIEIRAHLDLRALNLADNPDIPGEESVSNRKRLALLYATHRLRSVRGNCLDSDPVAALQLSPDVAANLLPLKPRQCLLIVSQTWLMVNGGHLWIDNVYLTLRRKRLNTLPFAFVTAGALGAEHTWPRIVRSTIFLSNMTFQGEHPRSLRGIVADITAAAVAVEDCIFTDWAGFQSPLTIKFRSVMSVRNTIFRNMNLHVEIADVSFEGIVHFEDVRFANVTLEHGAVVSTTLNDYQQAIGFYVTYYADDDAEFDVQISPVLPGEQGVFAEDFVVVNDTMSDCVYLLATRGTVLPGCSKISLDARKRVVERSWAGSIVRSSTGVPFTLGPGYDYAVDYDQAAAPVGSAAYDYEDYMYMDDEAYGGTRYEIIFNPAMRFQRLLPRLSDPWIQGLRKALPTQPAPLDWPPFILNISTHPVRQSLLPEHVKPPAIVEAAMLLPLNTSHTKPTDLPLAGRKMQMNVTPFAVMLAIMGTILVAAMLRVAVIQQHCTLWPPRAPKNRLKAASTTPSREDSSTYQVSQTKGNAKRVLNGDHLADPGTGYAGVHNCNIAVPSCAMNPAYEYPLSTQVARLMSRGSIKTDKEASPDTRTRGSREDCGSKGHVGTGTRVRGGSPNEQASYQTALDHMPAAGHTSTAFQVSTGLRSSLETAFRPLAPPPLQGDFQGLTTDGLSPASPSPVKPKVNGVRFGCARDTVSTRDTTGSSAHDGGRLRRWRQSWPGKEVVHDTEDAMFEQVSTGSGKEGEQMLRRLQQQLDGFQVDDVFLERFQMFGRQHRRRGGQAVVQFVEGVDDRREYAVKFYLDYSAFVTEAALYAMCFPHIRSTVSDDVTDLADAPAGIGIGGREAVPLSQVVARFLPQVEAVYDSPTEGLQDPEGRSLPPCIVMEKGESLQDWSDRAKPDFFTAVGVLSNIAERLADMHDAGYVHRDIKPANVVWLPRQNRWTVIDFGCAARIGQDAPLSFTLAYAAPEVVRVVYIRQHCVESTPALDAWSLGVMAFELLTGAPAFDFISDGRARVMQRLRGDLPLPWEGELRPEVRRSLGAFQWPILKLLQRGPLERMTMRDFQHACTEYFAMHTTIKA